MTSTTLTPHVLQQFNQCAIAHRFTGIQTQLWQYLYWLVYTYGQGMCIPTYHLLETMQISRSQLLRARNALVQAGCLKIDKINNQRLHYTLMLNGVPIDAVTEESPTQKKLRKPERIHVSLQKNPVGGNVPVPHDVLGDHAVSATHTNATPSTTPSRTLQPMPKSIAKQKPKQSIPTGVAKEPTLTDREMEVHLNAFADSAENRFGVHAEYHREALREALLAWQRMRSKYNWRLTRTGLNHLLLTLLDIGKGDLYSMAKAVNQSVRECWKGFYPYREKQIKSGAALRKQEEKLRKERERQEREREKERERMRGRIPYYDTKRDDLNFLEW